MTLPIASPKQRIWPLSPLSLPTMSRPMLTLPMLVSLEIRPVFEAEDFGEAFTPELQEQENRLRQRIESQD